MIGLMLAGFFGGLGVWFLLRGYFPHPQTLAERLQPVTERRKQTTETVLRSMWGQLATTILLKTRGENLEELESDLAVTGIDIESHAVEKLNAAIGTGALLVAISKVAGWSSSLVVYGAFMAAGMVVGYLLPGIELKRKAATRREEFGEALNAFVSLVAVSIAGGGGVNSAMRDATTLGGGWAFEAIAQALDEASLFGYTPWSALDQLGRDLDVIPLIELAGALSLAGTSGARIADTLRSRAESGREKALSDMRASAEKKSEAMNLPIGVMLLGWVLFMGYPAVATLLGGGGFN